ncbi:hypothetical protein A4S05_14430 [Nostoc sp. KVJ20]|uniref:hypothetical protein n=1 Tax=Nostoc sp. KVJ20 TaxID=457944 RepID=UPI00083D3BF7|nr:hypothetical protein [Nostoc sp. KVJ20]ODG97296.1 hypothetical protein A4S05_14430 [Nostoc sp. KVJ20]
MGKPVNLRKESTSIPVAEPSATPSSVPQLSLTPLPKLTSQPSSNPVQSPLPLRSATQALQILTEKKVSSTSSTRVKRSSTAKSVTWPSKDTPKKLNSISSSTEQSVPQLSASSTPKSTSVTPPSRVIPSPNPVHPIEPNQSDPFSVAEQPVQPPQSITLQAPLTSKESSKEPSVTLQAPLTSKELSKEPSVTLQQPLTSLEH